MSKVARHPRHPAVVNMSLEEIAQRYTIRFADIKPDWNVFGDSNYDGYRRAQFRYIGETLGKPEIRHIPAGATRLSVMYVPPGEGNAPHTHPVEEVFFILKGESDGILRGRRWPAHRGKSRPLGLCLVPRRGHSWISEQRPRARLPAGDGRAKKARADGLRRCEVGRRRTSHTSRPWKIIRQAPQRTLKDALWVSQFGAV